MNKQLAASMAFAGAFLANSIYAQVSFTGATYGQNFNTLSTSGGTWTDNTTLTGWYARTDATSLITTYGANTGSTITAGLYGFGAAGNTDRALGYAPTNAFFGASGSGQGYLGLRLNNAIGTSLTTFSLGYTGEQWRQGDTTANQQFTVQYKIGATAVNDATGWTTISALTFNTPQDTGSTAAIDGNNAANRVVLSPVTTTLSVAPGANLWIRWIDLNDVGNDHFIAIDDVSFSATAIPEPGTVLGGLLATCGLLCSQRRRLARLVRPISV